MLKPFMISPLTAILHILANNIAELVEATRDWQSRPTGWLDAVVLQDKNQFPPLSISKWSLWCHKSVQFHGTYDDLPELRKKEKKRNRQPGQNTISPATVSF
jgi:hypothetical protein